MAEQGRAGPAGGLRQAERRGESGGHMVPCPGPASAPRRRRMRRSGSAPPPGGALTPLRGGRSRRARGRATRPGAALSPLGGAAAPRLRCSPGPGAGPGRAAPAGDAAAAAAAAAPPPALSGKGGESPPRPALPAPSRPARPRPRPRLRHLPRGPACLPSAAGAGPRNEGGLLLPSSRPHGPRASFASNDRWVSVKTTSHTGENESYCVPTVQLSCLSLNPQ